jgi:hypothetical protein
MFIFRTIKEFLANKNNSWNIDDFQNPQWLLMYIFSRFETTRSLLILFYKSLYSNRSSVLQNTHLSNSLFENLDADKVVEDLRRDGFSPNISLPKYIVDSIYSFIGEIDYFPDHDGQRIEGSGEGVGLPGITYAKTYSRGRYPEDFLNCKEVKQIINDPKLLYIAIKYLGVQPLHIGSRLWWSFSDVPPYDLNRAGQNFHYDIDDYRSLRFFFYLTDVGVSNGPHAVIRGSHTNKSNSHRFALSRFFSDEELGSFYKKEDFITLCGKRGYGFAEEPSIFHKGVSPKNGDRLILLIQYAINDWGVQKGGGQLTNAS